jgi:Domain of unknown function (DUF4124)
MTSTSGIPTFYSLRLHEWFGLLALLFLCNGVHAATVNKCVAADGSVAYQSTPCAANQMERVVDIPPAPAFAPSPVYAIETHKPQTRLDNRRDLHAARKKTETAFECRGSGGEVFYRLGHCPHSVAGESTDRRTGAAGAKSVSVSGHPVSRSEACSEMRRAGSIGRKGHQFDESISSYDRNVGNDPCK